MLGDEAAVVTWKKDLQKAKEQEIIKNDTAQINVQWIYDVYILGLKYSMPSPETGTWQANTNLFLVYLYTVLTISQGTLIKVYNKLNTNQYLQDLKKTTILTEKQINELKTDIVACNTRLRIYETILKQLFKIPYKETNLTNIGKYFPTFEYLTESQINTIKDKIVDPLFFGKFHNVYGNSPIVAVGCNVSENGDRTNCKLYSVSQFPFPSLDPNNSSTPDCIKPFLIYNEVAYDVKKSIDIFNNIKWYHRMVAGLTGTPMPQYLAEGAWAHDVKDWVEDKAEKIGETANAAAEAAQALAGNMYDAVKSAGSFFTSGNSTQSSFTSTILKLGVAGLITYVVVKEIG